MLRRTIPLCLAGILAACGGSSTPEPNAAPAPTTAATPPPSTGDASTVDASTGNASTGDASAVPSTSPAPAATTDPNVFVPAALEFSAPLLGGGDIELTTLAGRPVLLWFWAPW